MKLENGRAWGEVRAEMESFKELDFDWKGGRLPSYIYYLDEELLNIQREAYAMYMVENGLGKGRAFPSLARMEDEVIRRGFVLLGGSEHSGGIFTSGGTESILLAVKAAREWAKRIGKKRPYKLLLSETGHPAFNRAAGLMEIEVERFPMREHDFKFDLEQLNGALGDRVIMIVGSAPSYAAGTFDEIAALGEIALKHDLWLHVDACVGGFLAPFSRMNGKSIPDFDLRVPGVRSLSADIHKYGFAAKGASLVLFASTDDKVRALRLDWARGTYQSESNQGTRAGGAVATAYAVMNVLGNDGYKRLAKITLETVERLTAGIDAIEGLEVIRPYELCIFAYKSAGPGIEINAVADEMGKKGWFIGRSQRPAPSIQMTVNPVHAKICDEYLADLSESVAAVRKHGLKSQFDKNLCRNWSGSLYRPDARSPGCLSKRPCASFACSAATSPPGRGAQDSWARACQQERAGARRCASRVTRVAPSPIWRWRIQMASGAPTKPPRSLPIRSLAYSTRWRWRRRISASLWTSFWDGAACSSTRPAMRSMRCLPVTPPARPCSSRAAIPTF